MFPYSGEGIKSQGLGVSGARSTEVIPFLVPFSGQKQKMFFFLIMNRLDICNLIL